MASGVRDKPYSWVVAVAGCIMYFIMYGLSRTTGQLFIETLKFFETDRETASFPFSLACALRYLAGPIAGAFAGRLGLRFIILFGSAMACIGVGGCFLATSINAIAVLWGVLFGLGSGISSTQLPQINNLYFAKHLTTANGISYAGAAIAGFVLPPIMECLLNLFDISGTYLLLSGIALHAIPAAILLKEPEDEKLPMISFEIPEEIRQNYNRKVSDLSIFYDNTMRMARRFSQRYTPDIFNGGTTQAKTRDNTECTISDNINSYSTTTKSRSFSSHNNESPAKWKSRSFSLSENILQNLNASQGPANVNIPNSSPYRAGSLSDIKEEKPLEIKSNGIVTDATVISGPEHYSRSAKGKSKSFSHPEVPIQYLNLPQDRITINLQTISPFKKTATEFLSEIKEENEPLQTNPIIRSGDNPEPPISIISRHASICSRSSSTCEKRESFCNSEGKNKGEDYLIECTEEQEHREQPPNMCLNDISIFWDLKFFLICFTGSINGFLCFVIPTILIDFCIDKGISISHATYITIAFSICDMVGRVGLGWVTDSKYMTRANFCAVCFLVLSAGLALFALSTGLIPMYLVLSVIGLCLGAHTPLPTTLIIEYIETSKHIMANASFDVLSVPFLLSTPSMIGYFRDGLGSYDLFVYVLCIISFTCGLMMLLLPYIKRREQQEEKSTAMKLNHES